MATEARIRELDARHAHLERRIEEELKRPTCDDLELSTLKKQKLRLKEQIETLRSRH
ncbi:MAG: DUF465 domain-containing protein [Pseudomonadota bacterium]